MSTMSRRAVFDEMDGMLVRFQWRTIDDEDSGTTTSDSWPTRCEQRGGRWEGATPPRFERRSADDDVRRRSSGTWRWKADDDRGGATKNSINNLRISIANNFYRASDVVLGRRRIRSDIQFSSTLLHLMYVYPGLRPDWLQQGVVTNTYNSATPS